MLQILNHRNVFLSVFDQILENDVQYAPVSHIKQCFITHVLLKTLGKTTHKHDKLLLGRSDIMC